MMAILQAIFLLLLRQLGRVLNTAFGWATSLLFGQVPKQRQNYLSAIALVSLVWLVAAVGVLMPRVGAYLLAFVTLPPWVRHLWISLTMLLAAALLPAVNGGLSLLLCESNDRPPDRRGLVGAVLRGYPYTLGLSLTLLTMLLVAPLVKLRDLYLGWSDRHIPLVVESADYFHVVDDVQQALESCGVSTSRHRAKPLLRWPTTLFTLLAGRGADRLVAREMAELRARNLEVLLHPSDLVIRGRERQVSHAYACLRDQLAFTKAYFTWSQEGRQVEDRLNRAAERLDEVSPAELANRLRCVGDLQRHVEKLNLQTEEWDVLSREMLQVECKLLRRLALDSGRTSGSPPSRWRSDDGSVAEKWKVAGAESDPMSPHRKRAAPQTGE